ncbi:MAG TPA: ATP-binding protein [Acidimicrobiales bacterium]|nr:ATP-binding protein [Acidimicrobiales bacterium]
MNAGDGEVRLEVPAAPEYLRMARMMAAGVASRLGFTLEEVEDLRIAIDELCYSLVGRAGRPGTIRLRYVMSGDNLSIEGTGHFDDHLDDAPHLSPLSEQILGALTDECAVESGPDGPTFRMAKSRQRPLSASDV